MEDTAVDLLLQNLNRLMNSNYPWICNNARVTANKHQLIPFQKELRFLRNFLEDTEDRRYEHEELREHVMRIGDVAYRANDEIDSFTAKAFDNASEEADHRALCLEDVMEMIKSIKAEVMEIYAKKMFGVGDLRTGNSSHRVNNTPVLMEDVVVGLEDEAASIIERLMGDQKQLQTTSIAGMAGLGKTTLAKKLYNDPCVVYHFHVRAWIYVSHTYNMKDLLLGCLKSASMLRDDARDMNDEKLCEEIYKSLKGRRYLIVLDDLWDTGAWKYLRRLFPDDKNGSRILVTSRLTDVISNAKTHFLRFLTEEESHKVLQLKVFKGTLSHDLTETGKKILKKCHGLPLAIVVIAGILAKISQDRWEMVANGVSSHMISDSEEFMETLALSYNNLPHHLKACFLYVGAFREESEIPVQKLVSLWIAEGFVRQSGQKCLEQVAESYMIDLIDRSLLTVARRRSDGGIKACRIHDLLRALCIRKAEDLKFLHQNFRSQQSSPFIRSYLWFSSWSPRFQYASPNYSENTNLHHFTHKPFKLLRVLDLCYTRKQIDFPVEIGCLVHLRYLSVRAAVKNLTSSITDLWNLETLCIQGFTPLPLPYNLGKMVNLRHLVIRRQTSIPHVKDPTSYEYPFKLINLQSCSTLLLQGSSQQVLSRIPMIRKLGCIFLESWNGALPNLEILIHLESLKVVYRRVIGWPSIFPSFFKFPMNLKKLTISGFHLPWTEVSTIGRLPNLEVLKLRIDSFKGQVWETNEGEFLRLRFLQFQDLDIEQWNAEASHFPVLQQLTLIRCKRLGEIPAGLGDICSLETIKVYSSSESAVESARLIQEEQQSLGNDVLKILIRL